MDEIRKNHIVKIQLQDKNELDGIVFDYEKDRVIVLISFDSLENAKKIKELEKVLVTVYTHLGSKKMFSHVITTLNKNNCIIIENSEPVPVEQKREFVRVLSDLVFKVEDLSSNTYTCYCENISAGGIAFKCSNKDFQNGEKVNVILPEEEFGKVVFCAGKIIKSCNPFYVAKFDKMSPYFESAIVKYVFKLISKK